MRRIRSRLVSLLAAAVVVAGVAAGDAETKAAPEFSLAMFNGKTLHLAALRGSGVILLFWAPW